MLGLYYMTRSAASRGQLPRGTLSYDEKKARRLPARRVRSPDEVRMAYDNGEVDLHAAIKVRIADIDDEGKTHAHRETTVGRVLRRRDPAARVAVRLRQQGARQEGALAA